MASRPHCLRERSLCPSFVRTCATLLVATVLLLVRRLWEPSNLVQKVDMFLEGRHRWPVRYAELCAGHSHRDCPLFGWTVRRPSSVPVVARQHYRTTVHVLFA